MLVTLFSEKAVKNKLSGNSDELYKMLLKVQYLAQHSEEPFS